MKQNVGSLDRTVRLIAGFALITLALVSGLPLFDTTIIKSLSVVVGVVMIATALTNFCPLYRVLGVRTCKV